MKKILLFGSFLGTLVLQVFSQSPNWLWAKDIPGSGVSILFNTTTDAFGHAYITGLYKGSLFSATDTLTAGGYQSLFVGKCDSAGNILWMRGPGGSGSSNGVSIATDPRGNVYAGGWQAGTVIIANDTFNTPPNVDAMILIKYNPSGNVLWSRAVGKTSLTQANSMATDAAGNLYVTGIFTGDSVVFGSTVLYNSSHGLHFDIFLAKYDSSGNVLWAKNSKGTWDEGVTGIAVDASNNIYITGYIGSDSCTFGSVTLVNAGAVNSHDIFIAKYDPSGNVLWAKRAGGTGYDQPQAIATYGSDSVYITGYFNSDSFAFGSTMLHLNHHGSYSVFIAKYDASGNAAWALGAGGYNSSPAFDRGLGIATDITGNLYVCGAFDSSSITFGTAALVRPASFHQPMFLVTFDPAGNVICGEALGDGGGASPSTVSINHTGDVYLGGTFADTAGFVIGSHTIHLVGSDTSLGKINSFLAKFNRSSTVSGIQYPAEKATFRIYPNPFSGNAVMQYNLPSGTKSASLIVTDILGRQRMVYQLNNNDGEITISAKNLSSGIYFYSMLVDGNMQGTKKIVIE